MIEESIPYLFPDVIFLHSTYTENFARRSQCKRNRREIGEIGEIEKKKEKEIKREREEEERYESQFLICFRVVISLHSTYIGILAQVSMGKE